MIAVPTRPVTLLSSNANIVANTEYNPDATYNEGAEVYIKLRTADDDSSYIGVVFRSNTNNNDKNPIDDNTAWSAIGYLEYEEGREYPENATVTLNGDLYLSQEANNKTSPLSHDSKWSYIGKDNANACLDYYFTTVTKKVGDPLVFEIGFAMADTIALFGIYGSKIKIEQLDSNGNPIITNVIPYTDPATITDFASYLKFGSVGGVQIDGEDLGTIEEELVDTSSIVDFASWLQFLSCSYSTSFISKLLISDTQRVRITIEPKPRKNTTVAEVATVAVGKEKKIGCTLRGLSMQRIALTPPKRDKWGDVDFRGDDYVKIYEAKAFFDRADVDYKDSIIEELFNQPCLYFLNDNVNKSFNTFGLMQDSKLTLDSPIKTELPIKIESFKYKKTIKEC